jgi:predicted  nucleic acid-binding Zn-ribbon protein
LNEVSFQRLENKVDKSTIDIVTKLHFSETKINRKLDKIDKEIQDMNSRLRKTEEDIRQADHRHIAAIDLIVVSVSERNYGSLRSHCK